MTTIMVPDLKPPSPESLARAFRVVTNLDEARQVIEEMLETKSARGSGLEA